ARRAAGGGQYSCTERTEELDGHRAHAAGSAVDQDGASGGRGCIRAWGGGGVWAQERGGSVEPGHVGQIGPQGSQRLGEGGRAGQVEMLWDGKQISGPCAGTIGVTPAVDQGRNAVAHGPAGDVGADLAD